MWLLHFFTNKQAAAALKSRIILSAKFRTHQKEGTLTPYCERINNPLQTCATYEVITETDANIMQSMQPQNKTPPELDDLPRTKKLCCHRVYDKYVLNGNFIEGLHSSIIQSMHAYWGAHKSATIHDLARHTNSFTNRQGGLRSSDTSRANERASNRRNNKRNQTLSALNVEPSDTSLPNDRSSNGSAPVMPIQNKSPNSAPASPTSFSSAIACAESAGYFQIRLGEQRLTSNCLELNQNTRHLVQRHRHTNLPHLPRGRCIFRNRSPGKDGAETPSTKKSDTAMKAVDQPPLAPANASKS